MKIEIDPRIALTGRIKTYLNKSELGTLPPSCKVRVFKNDLANHLIDLSKSLRFGAGVKVPLDQWVAPKALGFVAWGFTFKQDHPDFPHMTEAQKEFYWGDSPALLETLTNPTIITVADSMEENEGEAVSIEESWRAFIDAAYAGKSIIVDLSRLRPSGTVNRVGLTATGALGATQNIAEDERGTDSFLSIYEYIAEYLQSGDLIDLMKLQGQLCRVLRRGGSYKNGIVCTSLKWDHPEIKEYLLCPLADLPGGQRKAVRLSPDVVDHPEILDLIVYSVNEHSTFLEKIHENPNLYLNVCSGLYLADQGACLTSPLNLGKCQTPHDVIEGYVALVRTLCEIHVNWRKDNLSKAEGLYRPIHEDQQIGATFMGLANYLALHGITYKELIEAFEVVLEKKLLMRVNFEAYSFVQALEQAFVEAAKVAREYGIERFASIEPNQSVYTYEENKDLKGNYACRNIDPPFAARERRVSDTMGSRWYNHGKVETLQDVSHEDRQKLWEYWQELSNLATGGMAHAQSFDLTRLIDQEWLIDFIVRSPLKSTYYQQAKRLDQSYLNKGVVVNLKDDAPEEEIKGFCTFDAGCVTCGE